MRESDWSSDVCSSDLSVSPFSETELAFTKATRTNLDCDDKSPGSMILGAVGLYQPLVDFAGAGASVPLTGFGNLIAKGMKKAVEDDGLLGIFTGGSP